VFLSHFSLDLLYTVEESHQWALRPILCGKRPHSMRLCTFKGIGEKIIPLRALRAARKESKNDQDSREEKV
jgi:hypothetical protein